MKKIFFGWLCLATPLLPLAVQTAQFKLDDQLFTVPDGFEVELVATTDLVPRPVSASFDEQGRLYVTDSSGSNEKPEVQLKNPTHRILRLEDNDGDGRFDKAVVFADKVMFPEGCLYHDGSVYVAAPPSIWKFTDTDGDGVTDQRVEWFQGKTLTGCANDLHGPYLGPDGYLYWTKGAFAEQTHRLGNGRTLNDRAAHIFRARPDGSDLDVIMSGGMDNPVEVAFTPEGEAIFTSTFIDFSQPGFRDGIGHAVYGGVFGKVQEAIEDRRVKRTSPDVMHPFYQAGPSALSGLCRYTSDVFGSDYRDNFFATSFNLRKVTRHVLKPKGATYASEDSDFLVSDNPDFHPTDVLEAADGSLLVIDTGGWYKLCCPSSQLAKPDVLGGIYRVKKIGGKTTAQTSPARTNPNVDERVVAIKKISLTRDASTARAVRRNVEQFGENASISSHLARVSAEALGRIGDRDSIPALLQLADRAGDDEFLTHSAIYALIEIASPDKTQTGLKSSSPRIQRAALIALDQMDGGDLQAEDVTPFLATTNSELRKAAAWIASRHPEWGGALAGFFQNQIQKTDLTSAEQPELEKQLTQFIHNDAIQKLIAENLRAEDSALRTRQLLLRVIATTDAGSVSKSWIEGVRAALNAKEAALLRPAIAAARALGRAKTDPADLSDELRSIAHDTSKPVEVRLEALAASPHGELEPATMDFLLANLDPEKSVATRGAAASVLVQAKLNPEQLLRLAERLKDVGPMEVSSLLKTFERTTDEAVGLKLFSALKESKGISGARPDALKVLAEKFPASVQARAAELIAMLNVDAKQQSAHIDELLASLPKGEIRRGQTVFNSAKAACSACHKIGYLGGNVGPDLTAIGPARTERDLLEAIVYPSASFVRSYEPLIVRTKTDDDYSGVLRKDAADELVLATGPNTEVRIARSDIAEMRPGAVSVMPGGLDQLLTRQELADLLTFLKGTKWGPN